MSHRDVVRDVLARLARGEFSLEQALERLTHLPYEDLGFARLDHHRALRTGLPEVVYCESKTPQQLREIARAVAARGDLLATRAADEAAAAIRAVLPDAVHHEIARVVAWRHPDRRDEPPREHAIVVVSAGTADLAVAEEAAVTAEFLRNRVERIYDVGVAGLHRVLDVRARLAAADAVVVVAGMDGALPGVVAGLAGRPVVAVPTSVGYGAALGGLAALLTMLNACAPGVAVVNIDNGFGAACFASMLRR
jgi:NCAIR mutase (PurE)-related protein